MTKIDLSSTSRAKHILSRISVIYFGLFSVAALVVTSRGFVGPTKLIMIWLAIFIILFTIAFITWFIHQKKITHQITISNNFLSIPRLFLGTKNTELKKINELQLRGHIPQQMAIIGTHNGSKIVVYPSMFSTIHDYEKFIKIIGNIVDQNSESNYINSAKETITRNTTKPPLLTFIICAVLLFMFLVQKSLSNKEHLVSQLLTLGGLNKESIIQGEIWRIPASQLLHVNLFHLISNIAVLSGSGNILENILGRHKFTIIFLSSGIIASTISIMFSDYTVSVGASGSIYGLLGAFAYMRYTYRKSLPVTAKLLPGWILLTLITIDIGIGAIFDYIDLFMHLGGFFFGLLLLAIFDYFSKNDILSIHQQFRFSTLIVLSLVGFYTTGAIYIIRNVLV